MYKAHKLVCFIKLLLDGKTFSHIDLPNYKNIAENQSIEEDRKNQTTIDYKNFIVINWTKFVLKKCQHCIIIKQCIPHVPIYIFFEYWLVWKVNPVVCRPPLPRLCFPIAIKIFSFITLPICFFWSHSLPRILIKEFRVSMKCIIKSFLLEFLIVIHLVFLFHWVSIRFK